MQLHWSCRQEMKSTFFFHQAVLSMTMRTDTPRSVASSSSHCKVAAVYFMTHALLTVMLQSEVIIMIWIWFGFFFWRKCYTIKRKSQKNPSIHLTLLVSESGSLWQHAARCPSPLLHVLQLILGDPKTFPGQMGGNQILKKSTKNYKSFWNVYWVLHSCSCWFSRAKMYHPVAETIFTLRLFRRKTKGKFIEQ